MTETSKPQYVITTPPLTLSEVNEGDRVVLYSFYFNAPVEAGILDSGPRLRSTNSSKWDMVLHISNELGDIKPDWDTWMIHNAGLQPDRYGRMDSSRRMYALPQEIGADYEIIVVDIPEDISMEELKALREKPEEYDPESGLYD